ncbi:MAG: cytochrome ubiquinol oxidase subunit I [Pseudomonadota bacterium]
MDPVFLARFQFALTIGFHYIFPVVTIGLAWVIVAIKTLHLITEDPIYKIMARFWTRIFSVSFVVGVATGIVMEFQFGMNWAGYSKFVGDIFGAPLAAEGIFAFFLESTFLGLLVFGEKKFSPRMHWFSALMVALGATLSAFWIIVANSWQQTPAGYIVVNGRAELVDFWAAVFNPSTIPRYLHTVSGAIITGAFFVLGLSAWYLLNKKHVEFARRSLKIGLIVGFAGALSQLPLGHYHAIQVANTQPAKLAAFEGVFETTKKARLLVFGIPNANQKRTDLAIGIPAGLSILVGLSPDTEIKGLKDFERSYWPPLLTTFFSFHLMVALGMYFIALTGFGLWLLWKKRLEDNRLFLKLALLSIPLPFVANELGWVAAEVGRQPWIVYGELLTKDAISTTVPAGQVLFSIIMFSLIYSLLFGVWVFLLRKKMRQGPESVGEQVEGA